MIKGWGVWAVGASFHNVCNHVNENNISFTLSFTIHNE